MAYPIITIDGTYRRLIPSKWPTIDIYSEFGSQEMQDLAAKLEEITSPRLVEKARLTGGHTLMDEAASIRLQNWNHAPFTYPLPEGSFFLPPPIPVMELASDHRSSLARALLRREEFLSRTSEPPCGADMRMISNEIVGEFHDLQGLPNDLSQAQRREIGLELYEQNSVGVVFCMPEVPGGVFLNIFSNTVLKSPGVQGSHFRFGWDGFRVRRVYDFTAQKDIERGDLFLAKQVAA